MKQSHLSRAALLAATLVVSTVASAQSNVTIYGVADAYVQIGSGGAGTRKSLESGGIQGSRLGFKGSEDLGDGFRAFFQVENGFALDTGTVTQGGRFFGRQALVGLSGNWGSFSAGRQYTPLFNAIDSADPFGTGLGSVNSSGIMTNLGGSRVDNSLVYSTPDLAGFSLTLLAAAGEGVTGKSFGADVRYTAPKYMAALSVARLDRLALGTVDGTAVLLSGMYDFGIFKLMGAAQSVKHVDLLPANDDREEYYLGVRVPVGSGVFSAVYGAGKTKNVSGTSASEVSVGYDYALSKRTFLYVIGSDIRNGALTAFTADGATGSGPTTVTGHDVRAMQVGMRHRF